MENNLDDIIRELEETMRDIYGEEPGDPYFEAEYFDDDVEAVDDDPYADGEEIEIDDDLPEEAFEELELYEEIDEDAY